jgi:hypothetical protein
MNTFLYTQTQAVARITVLGAILSQVLYMLYYKSKTIFAASFYLFSLGSFLYAYVFYLGDNNIISSRTYYKLINAVLLLIIAVLATAF